MKMAWWGYSFLLNISFGKPDNRLKCYRGMSSDSGIGNATSSENYVQTVASRKGSFIDSLESWQSPHKKQLLRSNWNQDSVTALHNCWFRHTSAIWTGKNFNQTWSESQEKESCWEKSFSPLCDGCRTRDPLSCCWYRILLEKAFEEGIVLIYLWKFSVCFLIWCTLHHVSLLYTSLLLILLQLSVMTVLFI